MVNLVNVESRIEDGKSVLLLYFREGEKRYIKKIDWFKPYFYVDVPISNQLPEKDKTTIDGRLVWKIVANNTKEIYNLRKMFENTYEADIEFTRRFMVDNVKKLDKATYRVMTIDIETTTDYGFPVADNPVEKITLITIHDSITNKLITFAVKPDDRNYSFTTQITLTNIDNELIGSYDGQILLFDSESSMLKSFFNVWKTLSPDLVVGWNVVNFDLIYLFKRAEKLNIQVPFAFAFRKIHGKLVQKNAEETIMEGCVGFDLLLGYKTIRFQELPSYSLDWVSKYELNIEHPKRRILNFTKFWKENFEEFIKYNRNDVALTVKLNEVVGIIDYFEDIRSISLLPRIDMVNVRSKVIDNIMLNHFKQYAYPTALRDYEEEEENDEDKGGYVKNPEVGVYTDVDVIDFSGMYPSLIRTFNLSPETIVDKDRGDFTLYPPNVGLEDGVSITLKTKGILPQIVEYMQKLREYYTEMRDKSVDREEYRRWDQKRFAIKTVINSLYGVMLFKNYRLHNKKVGYAITYLGREINRYVHKRLEEMGVRVLYGDTDSSFIKHNTDIKKILEVVNNTIINDFVHQFSPSLHSYINVDLDKHYKWICFIAKKRYYGVKVNKRGEEVWDYVGVDIKRTNIPAIITDEIKQVLESFKNKQDVLKTIDESVKHILSSNDIDAFKIPLKLEINVEDYKVNATAKQAVSRAKEKWNLNFRRGDKFWGVYLKDGIIGFDEFDDERAQYILQNIDREKYVKDFIHKALHLTLMEEKEKELLEKYGIIKKKREKFSNTLM